jgi:Immunity protein 52
MNEHPFRFGIYYELPRRRETPAVIGTKFLHTLDALSRIDPLLATWNVLDRPALASLPLADARPRIATIVENFVVLDDNGQPEPESGYSAIGVTDTVIPSRIVTLRVGAGGLVRDEMMLHVGGILHPTDPLMVKYSLFRGALLATTAIWQPTWACVAAIRRDYSKEPIIPGTPLFPSSVFRIPWIAYLPPARTVGLPLPVGIHSERAPDGGLLFTVTEEPFNPNNPEHLQGARIVAETMIAQVG